MSDTPHLWAVTSGWDGPFQMEEVLVVATDLDDALRRAEAAFSAARQPVCRAKVRTRDFGQVEPGLVAGPRRSGASLAGDGQQSERRCSPEGQAAAE